MIVYVDSMNEFTFYYNSIIFMVFVCDILSLPKAIPLTLHKIKRNRARNYGNVVPRGHTITNKRVTMVEIPNIASAHTKMHAIYIFVIA